MSSLVVGSLISSGKYGSVYQGQWATRKVAIKKFRKTPVGSQEDDSIWREIRLLEHLRDKHIILFYGSTYHDGGIVLVMEYAEGGSLQGAIKKRLIDWPAKIRIAQEIVQGLAYIHHEDILHRDLKSTNVLLNKHMEAKLCDFRLAMVKRVSPSNSNDAPKGTLRWMAPELFVKPPKYSTKSDMYALGMVMWEMADNNTMPFSDQYDNAVVMSLVKSGEREDLPDDTPPEYRKIVERCWDHDPIARPEAHELIVSYNNSAAEGGADDAIGTLDRLEDPEGSADEVAADMNHDLASNQDNDPPPPFPQLDPPKPYLELEEFSVLLSQAESGSTEAQMAVAERYCDGKGSVGQSDTEAFKWRLQAAQRGHAQAQYLIGTHFLLGRGTAQSFIQAAKWFSKAANQGNANGQCGLGMLYKTGEGIKQDLLMAALWLRKAAEQGDSIAQFNLGLLYEGSHLGADYKEALAWYRKAAAQGNADAQNSLGSMYEHNRGVHYVDLEEALMWYRKAATQSNPSALCNFARFHEEGILVPRDISKAIELYRKAADQGNEHARRKATQLEQYSQRSLIGKLFHLALGS